MTRTTQELQTAFQKPSRGLLSKWDFFFQVNNWKVSRWRVWGAATIPKLCWSRTAVTAHSAVCVFSGCVSEVFGPRGVQTSDKCWHGVLDGVPLITTGRAPSWTRGGCVTFAYWIVLLLLSLDQLSMSSFTSNTEPRIRWIEISWQRTRDVTFLTVF